MSRFLTFVTLFLFSQRF